MHPSKKKPSLRERVAIVLFFLALGATLFGAGMGGEWLQHHRIGYTETKY